MRTAAPGTSTVPGNDVVRNEEDAVLFPVLSAADDGFAVDVASALADSRNAPLVLASTNIDAHTPSVPLLNGGDERVARRTQLAERARDTLAVPIEERHHPGMGPMRLVSETVADRPVDTVVVERPDAAETGFPASATERIDVNADCNVVIVSGTPQMGTVSSVLLAVAGGPHSWTAAGVARDIAATEGAWVDVMHVISSTAGEWRRTRGQRIMDTAMDRLTDDADDWLYEADDVADALVEQSRYYDLIVLGAPRKSRLREFVSGSTARDVRRDAGTAVVTVRRAGRRKSLLSQLVG